MSAFARPPARTGGSGTARRCDSGAVKANLKPANAKARALLKKLQALAEQGIGGEKISAQKKIARLTARRTSPRKIPLRHQICLWAISSVPARQGGSVLSLATTFRWPSP